MSGRFSLVPAPKAGWRRFAALASGGQEHLILLTCCVLRVLYPATKAGWVCRKMFMRYHRRPSGTWFARAVGRERVQAQSSFMIHRLLAHGMATATGFSGWDYIHDDDARQNNYGTARADRRILRRA
ncbi:MAG: hypothetical protein LBT71_09095, partial [Azoarcus sp.]|nr:hypothetical protein [Azoarcus sp.]